MIIESMNIIFLSLYFVIIIDMNIEIFSYFSKYWNIHVWQTSLVSEWVHFLLLKIFTGFISLAFSLHFYLVCW